MAWTNSKIFTAYIHDVLTNLTAMDLDTDAVFNAALFDNTVTPSQTVSAANSAYGAGVWAAGGVVDTGTSAPAGWPAVGRPLASITVSAATVNPITFDANDTVSANAVTTLTNAYGCLVYDDTIAAPVADQGVCYNYFGGANTVTLGTFTIVWNTSGIAAITH
jgi:hypothetical protein